MERHCSIILVNWNGWQDTIECLETILKQDYSNFDVIIVDNDSDDDSIERIQKWTNCEENKIQTNFPNLVFPLVEKPLKIWTRTKEQIKNMSAETITKKDMIPAIFLIKNDENVGFARANNLAIDFATNVLGSKYLFLLNNDTVVEKDCLSALIQTIEERSEYSALQSAIYRYDEPDKVWHFGARILPWYQTKYYRKIKKNEIKPVTFASGCALFITKKLIKDVGNLSEKFFFGEEDFEYSLRLKKQKLKLAVVESSKVYHKVASSAKKQWKNSAGKILNFALSRIIDMRNYLPRFIWAVWKIFVLVYFWGLMVFFYNIPFRYSLKLTLKISTWSKTLDEVKRQDVDLILSKIV